jgi:hypothetical protein
MPPGLLPAAVTPAFDVRVVLFGLTAALAVGVGFGMVPAWQATGTSLVSVMSSESRSVTATGSRLRSLLVASEVAAAVVLLCGAGLLLQTVLTLVRGGTGYRSTSESVLTLDFSVRTGKNSRYPSEEAVTQFYDAVGRDVASLPEVARASSVGGHSRSSAIRQPRRAIGRPLSTRLLTPDTSRRLICPSSAGAVSTNATRFTVCPCVSSTRRSYAAISSTATRSARVSR